jgi:4-carboxymuconolactone decarboxylase
MTYVKDILARIPGDGLKGEGFPRNVLGIIMQNSDTFGPFLNYWVTCKLEMGLTVREQEIVILRMGVVYNSDYVWKHHVKVGREFGIVDQEMISIRKGDYEAFVDREKSLLCLCDEIVNHRTVRLELWNTHSKILSPKDIVDLIHLTSQYMLFAVMNNAFQVQVEPALDALPGVHDSISDGSPHESR